jgi:hypothetical protein
MWRVASGLDWDAITEMSRKWSNPQELALAKSFVETLDRLPEGESGALLCEITASDPALESIAAVLRGALKGQNIVGVPVTPGVTEKPEGPSVACKVSITGTVEKPEALVQVATSNSTSTSWAQVGKFSLPVARETDSDKVKAEAFADSLAEGILGRMVRAQLSKPVRVDGNKFIYKVRIDNASPLILNGLAVRGTDGKDDETPKILSGISVSPGRSMTVPATGKMVEELGLKKGIRVIAADLSGL